MLKLVGKEIFTTLRSIFCLTILKLVGEKIFTILHHNYCLPSAMSIFSELTLLILYQLHSQT